MKIRVLSHGPQEGVMNMAIDEVLLHSCARDLCPPTLRFYGWDPACLTLGYFQDVEREVDMEGLRSAGVDMVRRLTGGKAVLHDDELTYSVVIPQSLMPGSVLLTYKKISGALVAGLELLGVSATMAALDREGRVRDPEARQAACFSAPSWFEVLSHGRKLVGSAQTRKRGMILQHGSIPFTLDAEKVVRCVRTTSPEQAERTARLLRRKAIDLKEALGRPVVRQEVEDHLIRGFQEVLGWELVPGELDAREAREASSLAKTKYGSHSWNMERGRSEEDIY